MVLKPAPLSILQQKETYVREDGSTYTREDIFVKLSVLFRDSMLKSLKGPPLSVYLCIALHCGGEEMTAYPSLKRIAVETGYSVQSVVEAIAKLEAADLVVVTREKSETKGNKVNRYKVKGYATMGDTRPNRVGVLNQVEEGTQPGRHEEDPIHEEPIKEEKKEQESADADALPFNFPGWHQYIKEAENGKTRITRLREMIKTLYPGLDPPNHGYVGIVAKRLHAGRLADLLWQHSTRPPTGDLLSYIQGVAKNGNKPSARKGRDTACRGEHENADGWVDPPPEFLVDPLQDLRRRPVRVQAD